MSEVRMIVLPKGGILEVKIEPGFYDRIRAHFNMQPDQHVDDDSIRMFVFGACKTAFDKYEVGCA